MGHFAAEEREGQRREGEEKERKKRKGGYGRKHPP